MYVYIYVYSKRQIWYMQCMKVDITIFAIRIPASYIEKLKKKKIYENRDTSNKYVCRMSWKLTRNSKTCALGYGLRSPRIEVSERVERNVI